MLLPQAMGSKHIHPHRLPTAVVTHGLFMVRKPHHSLRNVVSSRVYLVEKKAPPSNLKRFRISGVIMHDTMLLQANGWVGIIIDMPPNNRVINNVLLHTLPQAVGSCLS